MRHLAPGSAAPAPARRAPRVLRLALLGIAALLLAPGMRPAATRGGERGAPGGEAGRFRRMEPGDWLYMQRAYPGGDIDPVRVDAAFRVARLQRVENALRTTAAVAWQNVGPANIGGRVTALAVTPNGNTIFLGAADGGIFRSTDAGANWTPVFDAVGVPSIGALALDPTTANIVYAGTGEANASVDSYDGAGVFKSTNGGTTWTSLGLESSRRIGAIVVDPATPSRLFVAAMGPQFSATPDRGFYKSEDGGAHWTRTLYVNDSTGVIDIAVNPVHPETLFCATWERIRRPTERRAFGPSCGIWRSIDHGNTWTRLANGLPTPTDSVGRIALAIAPSRPRWVYAQIVSGASLGYTGLGMWRSTDGGDSWEKRSTGSSTFQNGFGGFGWYFGRCAVDPADPNVVFALGQVFMRSPDGGVNWGDWTHNAHVDEHALWINPTNSAKMYMGSDGGCFATTNFGSAWSGATNLPISQFYAGAIDPANPSRYLGGTQDNDCLQTMSGVPGSWQSFGFQADGFYVMVDPTNPAVTFGEYQFGSYGAGPLRSTAFGGAGSFASGAGVGGGDRFNWCAPMCMNPRNPRTVLCGSHRVYKSKDQGLNYLAVSGDLTLNVPSSLTFSTISTLDISAADTSTYYAGTDDGKVWRSTNAGGVWTDISAGLPVRWVTRVSADPTDPGTVYATLSGFGQDETLPHLFRSIDRGDHWTSIAGDLPDVPANDILADPATPNRLYLATDAGVYWSGDAGTHWAPLGSGMPVQAVFDLSLNAPARRLVAATHGRSQWMFDLAAFDVGVPPIGRPAPPRLALSNPAPNPFRAEARLTLELPSATTGSVAIYDALGRRTRTLIDGPLAAGRTDVAWDGRDERGTPAASGVYFVRALMGTYGSEVKRLVKAR